MMKALDKANEIGFKNINVVAQKCPDKLGILEKPELCFKNMSAAEQCDVQTIEGIPLICYKCWERRV